MSQWHDQVGRCPTCGQSVLHARRKDCQHDWEWIETEIAGKWAKPGDTHYRCKLCDSYKTVHADGSEKLDEL